MDSLDINGVVYNRGAATLLARVVDEQGAPLLITDIATVRYTVYEVDEFDPESSLPVAGHDSVAVDTASVFFDTLQTGPVWSVDGVGYNFRHELTVDTDEAFPKRGRLYQVRYDLSPYVGQRVVFRFSLRAL